MFWLSQSVPTRRSTAKVPRPQNGNMDRANFTTVFAHRREPHRNKLIFKTLHRQTPRQTSAPNSTRSCPSQVRPCRLIRSTIPVWSPEKRLAAGLSHQLLGIFHYAPSFFLWSTQKILSKIINALSAILVQGNTTCGVKRT